MFERFTDTITVVNLAREGNMDRLQKLIRGGCRMDRREEYDPWLTPLDAAVMAGNAACADLLLCGGAPVGGSSILEAIKIDSLPILEVFFKHDPSFSEHFQKDRELRQNPRLNRWLLHFTALDYALSIGSPGCSQFLTEIGAPKTSNFVTCSCGHHAPLIVEKEFVPLSGVDVVGFTKTTEGYYCAWCEADIENVSRELERRNKIRELIRSSWLRYETTGEQKWRGLAEYHEAQLKEETKECTSKMRGPWSSYRTYRTEA